MKTELTQELSSNSVTTLIKLCREKLVKEFGEVNHESNYYTGSKFKDDSRVLRDLKDEIPTKQSITRVLVEFLKTDYWYKFEKDWD